MSDNNETLPVPPSKTADNDTFVEPPSKTSNDETLPLPPSKPRKPPIRSFGGYEIEGELGRGGMGMVFLARQTELNRRVALKMLTGHYGADELQRFMEEAETAAGLNHTNIAHIYEVGDHDGTPFFSMEYVEGGTLGDTLRKDLPSPRDAAKLMIAVARALHFAHQHGVVHRDMKPGNVLIDPNGVPKVADFGIAKRLNEDSQLTRTGAIIGTPTYMAPEQASGNSRHVGPAADIYSMGVILYEMLAGRPPFLPEDSEQSITVRVLTEETVSPAWHRPEIPRDLETICMKCLEKEPRDRYASAGDFADDMQRYLDDESILAKPPNTVVKTVKWVRRNPWKFVGTATAGLLLIAALTVLTRWELYQRPHFEYARHVDWVNGFLQPVEKVSESQASRAPAYLRVTRRGRLGSITRVEVLNARGNPAVLRRVFIPEVIPIYIEGLSGAQPNGEKLPETSTIDFVSDNGNALEATSRDRNGQVLWRIIYDRSGSSDQISRARFVNLRGFESASQEGASHMEFERDKKGRDVKITFFDGAGKPAKNGEGVYGYKLERDEAGRLIRLENLGANGQPAMNRVEQAGMAITWGKVTRLEFLALNGQPQVLKGIAAILTEFDSSDNAIRQLYIGADGKPLHEAATGSSVEELKRNDHGEVTQFAFFKSDANGALTPVNHLDISYDEFGHPADLKYTGAKSWRSALRYDSKGNPTEEKNLDEKGNPVANAEGYAIKRSTYSWSPQGSRIEQTFFDASGNKTYYKGQYHRMITEFDTAGVLKRLIEDEHDQSHYKYYRFVNEPEYDVEGRSRHSISRYEDSQGQLAVNAGLPYTSIEEIYDDAGRLTTSWKFGADVAAYGGPVFRDDTEWYPNGKKKREIEQICDANRQPLPMISTGNAARKEDDYDIVEQLARIYETGFDEKVVGFITREAKFSSGSIQSVTHTRSDGSELGAVTVLITYVQPSANQPKAGELKAGDQLVAVNGKSITSAYEWLYAGKFPGGWIEVLRDGRRMRIDGFTAGSVGMAVEDRAPGIKPQKFS